MTKHTIQYTVRIDDPGLDRAVRAMAKKQNKSINETVILTLSKAAGYVPQNNKPAWATFAGSVAQNDAEDEALAAQRTVDKGDWQ